MATRTVTRVELLTPSGPEYREVSTAPPRPALRSEIPLIDLSTIDGSVEQKSLLASELRHAAEGLGFFYIQNHGIPANVISDALECAKKFFDQPLEEKMKVSSRQNISRNGYSQTGSSQINRTESRGLSFNSPSRYKQLVDRYFR